MYFNYHEGNFRKWIVFLGGYQKEPETWNTTDLRRGSCASGKGKQINVEISARKRYNTLIVTLDPMDYERPIAAVTEDIRVVLTDKNVVVIVAHSFGAVYALELARCYPKTRLLLLDPTLKTDEYLQHVRDRGDPVLLDRYPELQNTVGSGTIVRIIIPSTRLSNSEYFQECLRMTKQNVKSLLIVQDCSHMVHYDRPVVVSTVLLELASLHR